MKKSIKPQQLEQLLHTFIVYHLNIDDFPPNTPAELLNHYLESSGIPYYLEHETLELRKKQREPSFLPAVKRICSRMFPPAKAQNNPIFTATDMTPNLDDNLAHVFWVYIDAEALVVSDRTTAPMAVIRCLPSDIMNRALEWYNEYNRTSRIW